jgi:hypothetical protein
MSGRHYGFSVHVLHSLAATAAEMGFSELTIRGLLGHSVLGVTGVRTYPRLRAAGHSRSGSARIAAVLDGESGRYGRTAQPVETAVQA